MNEIHILINLYFVLLIISLLIALYFIKNFKFILFYLIFIPNFFNLFKIIFLKNELQIALCQLNY